MSTNESGRIPTGGGTRPASPKPSQGSLEAELAQKTKQATERQSALLDLARKAEKTVFGREKALETQIGALTRERDDLKVDLEGMTRDRDVKLSNYDSAQKEIARLTDRVRVLTGETTAQRQRIADVEMELKCLQAADGKNKEIGDELYQTFMRLTEGARRAELEAEQAAAVVAAAQETVSITDTVESNQHGDGFRLGDHPKE